VRTGPVQLPQYTGEVAVYAAQPPPPDAVDLGVVEVHGAQQEANISLLLPELVRRVAQIGGNVVLVEGVRARFDMVARNQVETFYYTCGLNYTCAGTRTYTINDEVMTVTMFGRALSTRAKAPAPQPLHPGDPIPTPTPISSENPSPPTPERPPLLQQEAPQ
jgi:hypothetical protein